MTRDEQDHLEWQVACCKALQVSQEQLAKELASAKAKLAEADQEIELKQAALRGVSSKLDAAMADNQHCESVAGSYQWHEENYIMHERAAARAEGWIAGENHLAGKRETELAAARAELKEAYRVLHLKIAELVALSIELAAAYAKLDKLRAAAERAERQLRRYWYVAADELSDAIKESR